MAVVNGYTNLAQVKNHLGIVDTVDDTRIEMAINAASRQIDGVCGRRFWQDTTVQARTFYPTNPYCLYVGGDGGISDVTGLIVKLGTGSSMTFGTTLTVNTDFILAPTNAADQVPVHPYDEIRLAGRAFTMASYFPTVEITAKWGWPAVPDDITEACILQAAQIFKAKDAVFGAVALGDTGVAMRVRSALNPIADGLVAPYKLPGIA
jgi:hypothetical protein